MYAGEPCIQEQRRGDEKTCSGEDDSEEEGPGEWCQADLEAGHSQDSEEEGPGEWCQADLEAGHSQHQEVCASQAIGSGVCDSCACRACNPSLRDGMMNLNCLPCMHALMSWLTLGPMHACMHL